MIPELASPDDEQFHDVALEIGRLTIAWNRLQETLGILFWITTETDLARAMMIWHSIKSDRTQREMLRSTLKVARQSKKYEKKSAGIDEIEWILDRVNTFEDRRNDAIHTPPVYVEEGGKATILPSDLLANPRALKLRNKNLLAEFPWYRATARTLGGVDKMIDA